MKLALMLIHEHELGETSRLGPYLQYLPTEFNTPFSWSDRELQQLGYPFVTQQVFSLPLHRHELCETSSLPAVARITCVSDNPAEIS